MKIRLYLILGMTSMLIGTSHAQHNGWCGTDHKLFNQRLDQNLATLAIAPVQSRSAVVKYVPVTFHLVADNNGNGRAREEQALEQLAKLNEYYAEQDMIYYIDELRFPNNTLIFTDPGNATAIFQMRLIEDADAMNVYVVQNAGENELGGIVLGFYSIPNDWIVIRKDEFNGFNNTLAHEGGHFWSLKHTFDGWDCEPYEASVHGNPVNIVWSPCNGSLRIELENGSNCSTAGDRICDTNPDYNFGYGWSVGGDQCAPFSTQVMDSNGDLIDVEEQNHMGYFLSCDDYFFTPTQQSVIQNDYFTTARAYLRTGKVPEQDPVDNSIVYNYPIGGEEVPTFDQIDLDWEDEDGATDYLVIIDRFPSFTSAPKRYFVQESFLTIDQLTPNVPYYWKVWPFNESKTGAGWASTQTFRTGIASDVETIASVNRINVFPNPVTSARDLTVVIESTSAFDADFELYTTTGAIAWGRNAQTIEAGHETRVDIPTQNLLPGLYFLQIRSSEGGVISKKVSVQ